MTGGVVKGLIWRISRGLTAIMRFKSQKNFTLDYLKKTKSGFQLAVRLFGWNGSRKYPIGSFLFSISYVLEYFEDINPRYIFKYAIKEIDQEGRIIRLICSGRAIHSERDTGVGWDSLQKIWESLKKIKRFGKTQNF